MHRKITEAKIEQFRKGLGRKETLRSLCCDSECRIARFNRHAARPSLMLYSPAGDKYKTGRSSFRTESFNAGTSEARICFQAANCRSRRARSILNTSYCCWVGAPSPASTMKLKLLSCSLSILGKARLPSEPFIFT